MEGDFINYSRFTIDFINYICFIILCFTTCLNVQESVRLSFLIPKLFCMARFWQNALGVTLSAIFVIVSFIPLVLFTMSMKQ